MGDSAAALWDSELLRARQWLAATRRDEQQERERLFQRVKAHISFKDHQRSLQSESVASEEEDDGLGLDFLADVDVADMNALLQAEATKAANVPRVEAVASMEIAIPSARDLMEPLEMPSNLLASRKRKPKVKPVPMSLLDPKAVARVTTTTMVGATLGDDAAVDALLQDLQVDVTQLQHSDAEEGKTEESTPPHLLKNFGGKSKVDNNAQTDRAGAGGNINQSKYMHQASSKSPQDPHKKKVATAATTKPDELGAEMLSWVSGYRDPEVMRRKENMAKRKRKHTHLYGVSSEEERRQVLLHVKEITHDINSDSESGDDLSSDYSPAEDEEVPEPDEPEVVDLLSDDYLDSDEDKRSVKGKRKRLRQAETTQKKRKARSRKPSVTRKLAQQDTVKKTPDQPQKTQATNGYALREFNHTAATTKSTSMEESDENARGNPTQPIELLSSGDEAGDSEKSGTSKSLEHLPTSSTSVDRTSDKSAESDVTQGPTIVRLKISKCFQSSQGLPKEASPNKFQQTQTTTADVVKPRLKSSGMVGNEGEVKDPASGLVSSGGAAGVRTKQGDKLHISEDPVSAFSDANGDDADVSDTGTIDLEDEGLAVENEEKTDDEEVAVSEKLSDNNHGAALEEAVTNADNEPTNAEKNSNAEVERSGEADDDDVSEAETEILEDDDPETDDLGLDYSDDSDSEGKAAEHNHTNVSGGRKGSISNQKDPAGSKEDTPSNDKTVAGKPDDSDSKQQVSNGDTEDTVSASTAGVQQFFDFVPLKLKPKSQSTTTTAPKPLPVHGYAETHLTNGKASDPPKKFSHTPEKTSVGSNGLRPSKKPIATTTTMKGKYAQTRRSTKLLNPEDTPGAKRQQKKHYTMVATQKSTSSNDLDDVPLAILAKEMSKRSEDKPSGKYLSYAGAKKTEDAPSYATKTPSIVPKSRFGGGGLSSSSPATKSSLASSSGQHSQVNDKNASRVYRQEPQISIYDALHMDGQENGSDIHEGTIYKRPSRFKKMQEEAARNGTPMVKSRLQDTDWDKVPIPKKKKKQALSSDKPAHQALRNKSSTSERGPSNPPGHIQKKRRKKKSGSDKNSGSSYYGPQPSQSVTMDKYESPSRGRRGRENNNSRHDDDRRRKRSPSPPFRDRDRHSRDGRSRDDRRRRGSSRSKSRSRSPSRDYGSNHYRYRSRSRSQSKERSHEREYGRSEIPVSNGRARVRDPKGSKQSPSSDRRSPSKSDGFGKTSDPPELGKVHRNGKTEEADRSPKKQKTSHNLGVPTSPGALATFDDDGDNFFISDSDDDGNGVLKEAEDIRFDLESVSVDKALMARQVYVTGVNPTVCAEQIEEDFARFGVAVDRETGFPAISIFPCQRNHLGRGDACVVFETEEGAREAVEELDSKNIKNSMIRVRRMDVHTLRILTVQFQLVRDTWKCTGTQCRADVSVWNPKCDKCGRKRVFGPSNIKIGAESWLCSFCFTANDSFAMSCHGCKEALPEVDRTTFYSS